MISCLSCSFSPILLNILRQYHFLSWPQIHSSYKKYSDRISFSVLAANLIQFYRFLLDKVIFCLSRNFIPIKKIILRPFHFLSQPKIHSIFKKNSVRISFSVLDANSFQFYKKLPGELLFLSQPKFHSNFKKKSKRNSFFVLAANSTNFYNFILRENHFLSQPQITSSSTSLFKIMSFSVLAALSFQFKKNSEKSSFSVLAANSIQFYRFLLSQNHFISWPQIHSD